MLRQRGTSRRVAKRDLVSVCGSLDLANRSSDGAQRDCESDPNGDSDQCDGPDSLRVIHGYRRRAAACCGLCNRDLRDADSVRGYQPVFRNRCPGGCAAKRDLVRVYGSIHLANRPVDGPHRGGKSDRHGHRDQRVFPEYLWVLRSNCGRADRYRA